MSQPAYLTVDELKATLELTGTSFANYDLPQVITAASRGVDEYAGRTFYSGTQTCVYTWCGEHHITIDDFISLTTVAVDYDRDGVYETTWTQGTQFLVSPYNAALTEKPYEELELLPTAWYRPPRPYPARIQVVGTFGWPAVPAPVKQATTILAARLLMRAREAPFGVVAIGPDLTAVRISRTDTDVAFLLEPYVKGRGVLAA